MAAPESDSSLWARLDEAFSFGKPDENGGRWEVVDANGTPKPRPSARSSKNGKVGINVTVIMPPDQQQQQFLQQQLEQRLQHWDIRSRPSLSVRTVSSLQSIQSMPSVESMPSRQAGLAPSLHSSMSQATLVTMSPGPSAPGGSSPPGHSSQFSPPVGSQLASSQLSPATAPLRHMSSQDFQLQQQQHQFQLQQLQLQEEQIKIQQQQAQLRFQMKRQQLLQRHGHRHGRSYSDGRDRPLPPVPGDIAEEDEDDDDNNNEHRSRTASSPEPISRPLTPNLPPVPTPIHMPVAKAMPVSVSSGRGRSSSSSLAQPKASKPRRSHSMSSAALCMLAASAPSLEAVLPAPLTTTPSKPRPAKSSLLGLASIRSRSSQQAVQPAKPQEQTVLAKRIKSLAKPPSLAPISVPPPRSARKATTARLPAQESDPVSPRTAMTPTTALSPAPPRTGPEPMAPPSTPETVPVAARASRAVPSSIFSLSPVSKSAEASPQQEAVPAHVAALLTPMVDHSPVFGPALEAAPTRDAPAPPPTTALPATPTASTPALGAPTPPPTTALPPTPTTVSAQALGAPVPPPTTALPPTPRPAPATSPTPETVASPTDEAAKSAQSAKLEAWAMSRFMAESDRTEAEAEAEAEAEMDRVIETVCCIASPTDSEFFTPDYVPMTPDTPDQVTASLLQALSLTSSKPPPSFQTTQTVQTAQTAQAAYMVYQKSHAQYHPYPSRPNMTPIIEHPDDWSDSASMYSSHHSGEKRAPSPTPANEATRATTPVVDAQFIPSRPAPVPVASPKASPTLRSPKQSDSGRSTPVSFFSGFSSPRLSLHAASVPTAPVVKPPPTVHMLSAFCDPESATLSASSSGEMSPVLPGSELPLPVRKSPVAAANFASTSNLWPGFASMSSVRPGFAPSRPAPPMLQLGKINEIDEVAGAEGSPSSQRPALSLHGRSASNGSASESITNSVASGLSSPGSADSSVDAQASGSGGSDSHSSYSSNNSTGSNNGMAYQVSAVPPPPWLPSTSPLRSPGYAVVQPLTLTPEKDKKKAAASPTSVFDHDDEEEEDAAAAAAAADGHRFASRIKKSGVSVSVSRDSMRRRTSSLGKSLFRRDGSGEAVSPGHRATSSAGSVGSSSQSHSNSNSNSSARGVSMRASLSASSLVAVGQRMAQATRKKTVEASGQREQQQREQELEKWRANMRNQIRIIPER